MSASLCLFATFSPLTGGVLALGVFASMLMGVCAVFWLVNQMKP